MSRHHANSHDHGPDGDLIEFPSKRRRPAPKTDDGIEGSKNRTPMSFSTTDSMKARLKAEAKRGNGSVSGVINAALTMFFQTKMQRSSWDVSDEEGPVYNRKRFYTASDDSKGHSAQLRLYVPKGLAGQVARIVNSGVIPEYRSNADFFRDAITHRAYEIGSMIDDEELVAEVDMLIMLAEEHQIQQTRADVEKLISAMRVNIEDAVERSDWQWLKAYLVDRKEKAGSIPEIHRARYLEAIHDAQELVRKYEARKR